MRKAMLIIRDGWGHGPPDEGNAIFHAKTPNHDAYKQDYPTTILACSGNAVGNPENTQGGSEVGHLTMGAGRIVWQPYELINQAIGDGSFFDNKVLISAIEHCKRENTDLHLSGLFSTEGVHADYRHMLAVLELCRREKFRRVFVHLCLDGRDMPERSALPLLSEVESEMERIGVGRIASVFGRYYGMDRDTNWDRTQQAYDVMVDGVGYKAQSAREAIEMAYERGEKTDYYVKPTTIVNDQGESSSLLTDGDAFIWYNFRSDRARQITAMINGLDFCPHFPEHKVGVYYVCLCSYDSNWTLPVAFPPPKVANNLGRVIADNGLNQLRISETEKYAHVTFFFNSQVEQPNRGETRLMVDSPKVASYDLQPEMSAYQLCEKLHEQIGKHDLIVVNYVNPDLVGHSGVFSAVVKACEVVDECVGKTVQKALAEGYVVFLMADHGNAEHMLYENGEPDPSHGFNPVRLTIIADDEDLKLAQLRDGGGLSDVAPTILDVMGIDQPVEMTGETLIMHE